MTRKLSGKNGEIQKRDRQMFKNGKFPWKPGFLSTKGPTSFS